LYKKFAAKNTKTINPAKSLLPPLSSKQYLYYQKKIPACHTPALEFKKLQANLDSKRKFLIRALTPQIQEFARKPGLKKTRKVRDPQRLRHYTTLRKELGPSLHKNFSA